MKRFVQKAAALLMAAALTAGAAGAQAESAASFDATVVGTGTQAVKAPIGGTVAETLVAAGDRIQLGDPLATLETTKVYATEDGTITGIFGQAGDSTAAIAEKYGAVLYLEPSGKYTIAASTENAYSSAETKYVHAGEAVYLRCTSDGEHTGTGVVTKVDLTDYTVLVTSGEFYMDETVSVFRDEDYPSKQRIGRGTVERVANIAVTGTGSIVNMCVADGDAVTKGQLLFETLSGEYAAYYPTGNVISSTADGIVANVNLSAGSAVNKDDVVLSVYPVEALELQIELNEAELGDLHVDDPVSIVFSWNEDSDKPVTYAGTVKRISHVATDGGENTTYAAYVDFDADETTRIGMAATVTVTGAADEAAAEEPAAEEQE